VVWDKKEEKSGGWVREVIYVFVIASALGCDAQARGWVFVVVFPKHTRCITALCGVSMGLFGSSRGYRSPRVSSVGTWELGLESWIMESHSRGLQKKAMRGRMH
jgi:hypothetical protein